MMNRIDVLDKGYVMMKETNLIAPVMGSDLSPVNAARASFAKESLELSEADKRLLNFLADHSHTSPYRHATVTLEVKAPFMCARQWMKYRVGWEHGPDTAELCGVQVPEEIATLFWEFMRDAVGWIPSGDDAGFKDTMYARNEASRRYVTLEPEFYIPAPYEWRSAPENKKQGSGKPLPTSDGELFSEILKEEIERGLYNYERAMKNGVAPELARGFLNCMYFMYTNWWWTASLQGVAHFIRQRLGHDAQDEITQYAWAVFQLIKPYFPHSLGKLSGVDENA